MENLNREKSEIETVMQLLLKEIPNLKDLTTFEIKKVEEGVFALVFDGKNIDSYVNLDAKTIFNMEDIRDNPAYKNSLSILGYSEEEINGEFILHKDRNGKREFEDKFGKQYYDIITKARQYNHISAINSLLISKSNKELSDKFIENIISSKALRLIDLIALLKQGNIKKEQFDNYKDKVALLLPEQVENNDLFKKIQDITFSINSKTRKYEIHTSYITQDELDYYLDSNLITKKIYDNCIKELKAQNEISKMKTKEQQNIVSADLDKLRRNITSGTA